MNFVTADDRCRTEVNIPGMALKGFVFKKMSVTAPCKCDVKCEREINCQSYNYVREENLCELNNRTKEARPEYFRSDPARFYIRRLNGRAPLGSIPELPAQSCQEIKASEGKDTISRKYWLDPTGTGTAVWVYCDMNLEDVDECITGNHDCDVNANCANTVGGHNCTCKEGYTGDGRSCSADIDECRNGSHKCDVNANCTNTVGGHNCSCKEEFYGDGRSCSDVDECITGNHDCDVNANCANTVGGHNCTCKEGYTGDGRSCSADIDECRNGSHKCDVNANCTNTVGGHNCSCKEEFYGDGRSCSDKNCAEIYKSGERRDGVYTIKPDNLSVFDVFCDQTTAGGGWTVFQKRLNGSVDFFLYWSDYKHGFGDPSGEYWLGNDKIHRLTPHENNTLRVDMADFEGNTAYAEYNKFGVMSENEKYKLILGSYSGTAGDSLASHDCQMFSTQDEDNDRRVFVFPGELFIIKEKERKGKPQKAYKGNCADIYKFGERRDGVYTIKPDNLSAFDVFCDQTTAGGGWTVFQKRLDGSVDFFLYWSDYKHGFGDISGEFWLGNDRIERLTSDETNMLRVELEDFEGNTAYVEYDMFGVTSENDKYKLILGSYSGTAGDSLAYHHIVVEILQLRTRIMTSIHTATVRRSVTEPGGTTRVTTPT
ncbi:hypothetical protein ACROYT_G011320 [Oculina patagonica]